MVLLSIFKTILCIVSFFHICPEQDGTDAPTPAPTPSPTDPPTKTPTDAPTQFPTDLSTSSPTGLSCPDGELKATLTYPGDKCDSGETFKYSFAGSEAGERVLYLEIENDSPVDTNEDTFCVQDLSGATQSFYVTPCDDADIDSIILSIPDSSVYQGVGKFDDPQLCSDLEDCVGGDKYKYNRFFTTSFG